MPRLYKSTKSTQQILKGPNHILQSLYAQSRQLASIEALVKQFVNEDISVSSFKNNELTLITPAGGSATKVRYRQRNIIAALRRAGLEVSELKIKVQPVVAPAEPYHVDRHISPEAAQRLAETAQYIEDESLSKALTRLSKRADQA